jgi:hypothetical protein
MLRNDLITLLSQYANDPVTVDVNGIFIDVEAVTSERGHVVLVLNPEDAHGTLEQFHRHQAGPATGTRTGEAPVDCADAGD